MWRVKDERKSKVMRRKRERENEVIRT